MSWHGWKSWLAAGALSFCARPAVAAPAAPAAERADLVRRGEEAAQANRWADCVAALTGALAMEYTPAVSGDLGLCEEQAGQFPPAHEHLRRSLESAPTGIRTDPWKRYQAALSRVRERVALLIITTDPPDARVILDGHPVGKGDGRTVAVAPGKHTVAGRLDGYRDKVVETADLRAGDTPNVQITLEPIPRDPPPVPSPAPPSVWRLFEPGPSPRGVLVTAAYAAALSTLVSGGTTIGYEVHYRSMTAALDAKGYRRNSCQTGEPPADSAECAEVVSRAQARDTSANVWIGSLIALGALSGVAGLAMYLDRGPWGPKISATVGADGGGVFLVGNW